MPPDYDELPEPKKEISQIQDKSSKVKKLIIQKSETDILENNQNSNDGVENFILDKIKNN